MHVVYTDGSAGAKSEVGGYAWASPTLGGVFYAGMAYDATSNRMELLAVLTALRAFAGVERLLVVSDAAYVVNCFVDGWYVKWLREGWLKPGGKLKNRDLWVPLLDDALERQVMFRHVPGHRGVFWNEVADHWSRKARVDETNYRGRIAAGSTIHTIRRTP